MKKGKLLFASIAVIASGLAFWWWTRTRDVSPPRIARKADMVSTVSGMPSVMDRSNLYSETAAGHISTATDGALERVYVPNHSDNSVSVIDPATLHVVDTFKVGVKPQHIVPSWDLRTLWVANNGDARVFPGSLTPIDPTTGKPGRSIAVDDPYNLYWSPDGRSAIVVAETLRRLDFRDPHTLQSQYSIPAPNCAGINHADFSIDGTFMVLTCEFDGAVVKIDLVKRKVIGRLALDKYFDRPATMPAVAKVKEVLSKFARRHHIGHPAAMPAEMPQDVRISPDGKVFFVADMMADGVHVVDGISFKQIGFIPTGIGAHGLYPSRDGTKLYVANRGTNLIRGERGGAGSVSVIDFATRAVIKTWPVPGGGSPDMGNVSADGKYLWLSGRFDDEVYRFDTGSGDVAKISVGREPHGLTVWPQPGRYSLGHTGNMR